MDADAIMQAIEAVKETSPGAYARAKKHVDWLISRPDITGPARVILGDKVIFFEWDYPDQIVRAEFTEKQTLLHMISTVVVPHTCEPAAGVPA